MNQKPLFLAVTLIALLVIGGMFCFIQKQNGIRVPVADDASTGTVNAIETKEIQVSDGSLSFSFEIPNNWLAETRNAGERQMTEEELRNFLSTNYDGKDPKQFPNEQLSDYAYFTWDQLQKMKMIELKKVFSDREKSVGPYPNASVSASPRIWYGDWNGSQIDFYILPMSETEGMIMAEKKAEEVDLRQYSRNIADMLRTEWTTSTVDGRKAIVANYQLEVLENGERIQDGFKGRPGGKKYYVSFPEVGKTLVIDKQSFIREGDFEKDFNHLIQTIRF